MVVVIGIAKMTVIVIAAVLCQSQELLDDSYNISKDKPKIEKNLIIFNKSSSIDQLEVGLSYYHEFYHAKTNFILNFIKHVNVNDLKYNNLTEIIHSLHRSPIWNSVKLKHLLHQLNKLCVIINQSNPKVSELEDCFLFANSLCFSIRVQPASNKSYRRFIEQRLGFTVTQIVPICQVDGSFKGEVYVNGTSGVTLTVIKYGSGVELDISGGNVDNVS